MTGLTTPALARRRAEVVTAAERAPDAASMLAAANAALALYVPSCTSAWSVADPGTLLPSWPMYVENVPSRDGGDYWEREFLRDTRVLFRELAQRTVPVGRLHAETSGLLARSVRYRECMAPLGYTDNMRAVLRVSGAAWGLVELLRDEQDPPFSADEAAFVAGLVEPLARILRTKVIRSASRLRSAADSPGLMVFGADGALVSSNDAAAAWLQEIPNPPGDPNRMPGAVTAVLRFARAVAAGGQLPPARVRVRDRSGRWIVLDACYLTDADGAVTSIAVVIEGAPAKDVAPIIVSAYDLSAREQEVTRLLAQGMATAGIAAALHLSVYTVRGYIKDIFAKMAVSSRGELLARLFTDHYQRPLAHAKRAESGT